MGLVKFSELKKYYNVDAIITVSDPFLEGLKIAKPITSSLDLKPILMHSLFGEIYSDDKRKNGSKIRTNSVLKIKNCCYGFIVTTRNGLYLVTNKKFGEQNGFNFIA